MNPLKIKHQNQTVEVVAKITDSLVQQYGCRVKYNRETGGIDLIGEDDCMEIVNEVLTDLIGD
jgi:hypothetical protein